MAERTVAHALYIYTEDGVQRMAMRGDTVTLSAKEAARGDDLGAFEPGPTSEEKKADAEFEAAQAKAAEATAKQLEKDAAAEAKAAPEVAKAKAAADAKADADRAAAIASTS